MPWEEIAPLLEAAKADDFLWRDGRMAVYFYYLDAALSDVQKRAYASFWTENNLGKKAFASLAKLEADVVQFGLDLMHAPADAAGTFTSGGSESIVRALQTARDWARAEKGIATPNFIVPRTAHPAFSRAGHALGIDVRRIATTRNDFKADVAGKTKATLVVGINRIPGLAVLEPHELAIFVTRASDPALDIGAVSDAMVRRGWFIGRQAEPPGIHMHLNPSHHRVAEGYLADLRAAVDEARNCGGTGRMVGSTY